MLHYSTYIHPVVYTNKTRQNIFASKSYIFIFRYILGNACIAITHTSKDYRIKKMVHM